MRNPLTTLQTWWLRRRATRWTKPGIAVIIDTETTDLDGQIVELAVIDAHNGQILFDTLINPRTPIAPQATAVHGITDAMVSNAPDWSTIWPTLAGLLHNRTILAWNATFDAERIDAECRRHHITPPAWDWHCLMRHAARQHNTRWQRLNGGHRALGDAQHALGELRRLTERHQSPA